MNNTKLKGISLRSPKEIRQELMNEWNWNIKDMARNYKRSTDEMLALLQSGGEEYQKNQGLKNPNKLVKATYDVTFCPMTNVEVEVANPSKPTEAEMETIVSQAIEKIMANPDDYITEEKLRFVKPCSINGKPVDKPKPLKPQGMDLEILVEITMLTYKELYAIWNDGVWVSNTIQIYAWRLTEKYWNTDWDEKDFWLTMEEEAEALVEAKRKEASAF